MSRKTVEPPSKYNPSISPQLDQCILKMVDLSPENRHQSIWDLVSEIETLSNYVTREMVKPNKQTKSSKFSNSAIRYRNSALLQDIKRIERTDREESKRGH
jgi:serine/threonine protein kinase